MNSEKTFEALSQNNSSFCRSNDRGMETEIVSWAVLVTYWSLQVFLMYAEPWEPQYMEVLGQKKDSFRVSLVKIVQEQKDF